MTKIQDHNLWKTQTFSFSFLFSLGRLGSLAVFNNGRWTRAARIISPFFNASTESCLQFSYSSRACQGRLLRLILRVKPFLKRSQPLWYSGLIPTPVPIVRSRRGCLITGPTQVKINVPDTGVFQVNMRAIVAIKFLIFFV